MFRQLLLGSPFGRAAMRLRDAYALLTAGREGAGTIANDQLAGFIVARLVLGKGVFVDVGAHIGSVIAEVRHHSPDSDVIAFEAIPEKAARLVAKFPSVRIESCALSDREGSAAFFVDTRWSGYSSLARGSDAREIEVPLRTLDGVLAGVAVDVIKIDVEGAELGVLRGGAALLAASRPTIMFESGPEEVLGYTKEAMWSFLAERDYAVIVPNRLAHNAPGLSLDGFLDSHFYPRRTTNYFAVPLEKQAEVRERARTILGLDRR